MPYYGKLYKNERYNEALDIIEKYCPYCKTYKQTCNFYLIQNYKTNNTGPNISTKCKDCYKTTLVNNE